MLHSNKESHQPTLSVYSMCNRNTYSVTVLRYVIRNVTKCNRKNKAITHATLKDNLQ